MHGNNGNKNKSGDVARGGAEIKMSMVPKDKVDDFRERIKREEGERKQNQSGGRGRGHSHS